MDFGEQYLKLRKLVKEKGLLDRTPGYYTRIIITLFSLFIGSWVVLYITSFYVQNAFLQWGIVIFLTLVSMQIGFLGHDAGHKTISMKNWVNELFGYLSMSMIGLSFSFWNREHNAHHKDPNHDPEDPDIGLGYGVSFTETQAKSRTGFKKWFTKYQHYFFLPTQSITFFALGFHGIRHVIKEVRGRALFQEIFFFALHFMVWLILPIIFLGWIKGISVYIITVMIKSVYFTLVFSPNHVGMPDFKIEEKMSYLEKQVVTGRNIKPHWFTDIFFGGLNYQIEHHIFSNISRKHLKKSKAIVKKFCKDINLQYEETGFFQCYRDVFGHLRKMAKLAH